MFHLPDKYRILKGPFGSRRETHGNNGAGFIPNGLKMVPLKFIASDQGQWEHVSVSLPDRCPTWEEMCMVKDLFWDPEDCVMQLHPPKSQWVNNHPYCLHLWRPTWAMIPMPPIVMVGYPDMGTLPLDKK